MAICVDGRIGLLKSASGTKNKVINMMWKIDIFKVMETLAEHGIISKWEASDDEFFFYVRNGYITLRRVMRRRGAHSLEDLLTSVAWSRKMIERFCKTFAKEASNYILDTFLTDVKNDLR